MAFNNVDMIAKGPLINWLFRQKMIYDDSAETELRKPRINRTNLAIRQACSDVVQNAIDKVIDMDTFHIDGETSDGYHTFNELYHHLAVLFSVIVSMYPELSWKSRLHDDGTMYDGMFIVGIDTPNGQATYHYDVDPYWLIFKCKELEHAPKWDGHTPEQAIKRIGTLRGLSNMKRHGGVI